MTQISPSPGVQKILKNIKQYQAKIDAVNKKLAAVRHDINAAVAATGREQRRLDIKLFDAIKKFANDLTTPPSSPSRS